MYWVEPEESADCVIRHQNQLRRRDVSPYADQVTLTTPDPHRSLGESGVSLSNDAVVSPDNAAVSNESNITPHDEQNGAILVERFDDQPDEQGATVPSNSGTEVCDSQPTDTNALARGRSTRSTKVSAPPICMTAYIETGTWSTTPGREGVGLEPGGGAGTVGVTGIRRNRKHSGQIFVEAFGPAPAR